MKLVILLHNSNYLLCDLTPFIKIYFIKLISCQVETSWVPLCTKIPLTQSWPTGDAFWFIQQNLRASVLMYASCSFNWWLPCLYWPRLSPSCSVFLPFPSFRDKIRRNQLLICLVKAYTNLQGHFTGCIHTGMLAFKAWRSWWLLGGHWLNPPHIQLLHDRRYAPHVWPLDGAWNSTTRMRAQHPRSGNQTFCSSSFSIWICWTATKTLIRNSLKLLSTRVVKGRGSIYVQLFASMWKRAQLLFESMFWKKCENNFRQELFGMLGSIVYGVK